MLPARGGTSRGSASQEGESSEEAPRTDRTRSKAARQAKTSPLLADRLQPITSDNICHIKSVCYIGYIFYISHAAARRLTLSTHGTGPPSPRTNARPLATRFRSPLWRNSHASAISHCASQPLVTSWSVQPTPSLMQSGISSNAYDFACICSAKRNASSTDAPLQNYPSVRNSPSTNRLRRGQSMHVEEPDERVASNRDRF